MNLFLDMDGTLIDHYFDSGNNYCIQERPYIGFFFEYIFDKFETVSIWTNASNEWFEFAYTILKQYIPPTKQFYMILTRDTKIERSNQMGFTQYNQNEIKNLHILYELYPETFNKYNTFIIDDSPYTYKNNIENSIPIKSYNCSIDLLSNDDDNDDDDGDDGEDDDDYEFFRIIDYLDTHLF